MGGIKDLDAVYVVSDLHMGGRGRGAQIFSQSNLLAHLIRALARENSDQQLAMVINGDMVDFLAEPRAKYFDPDGAVDKLDRIATDESFVDVWRALSDFVATPNRLLVIVLGNHDLELALPHVRTHLLEILAKGDASARGRVVLAFDGSGYLCTVGGAKVLCVHGNEVDPWNFTDYESLRRQCCAATFNYGRDEWIPNAGTKLVIEVINRIKKDFAVVDLLKPETSALVPTLCAIRPQLASLTRKIAAASARLSWDSLRRKIGFLGADDDLELEGLADAISPFTGPADAYRLDRPTRDALAQRMLEEVEAELDVGVEPRPSSAVDFLSFAEMASFPIVDISREDLLRACLKQLLSNHTFDLEIEDDTFLGLDASVGEDVRFLVAGHTHIERRLRRKDGRGLYFNCGTWARLIRFEPEMVADASRFEAIYGAMKKGTMAALDDEPGLVRPRPAVVCIEKRGHRTVGELMRVPVDEGGKLPPDLGSLLRPA
ncbi:MAG TPA: metallophosphoesterase [Planctomycetaceae bacterium]